MPANILSVPCKAEHFDKSALINDKEEKAPMPMLLTEPGNIISLIAVDSKATWPIVCRESGNFIFSSEEQLSNAEFPIDVRNVHSDMSAESKDVQAYELPKAYSPIFCKDRGKFMDFKEEQKVKV